MRKKTDYQSDKVLNLNDYIPQTIKKRIAEGLSDNILNRFMTKPEFGHFNGYVGDKDFRSELEAIPERTEFRTKNQLQPIVNASIATQNHHMTFQDFLRKLERTGVDIESFDEWGRSQQFNWVPPVNIDKLANFSNYYWDTNSGSPQYVTIKNQCAQVTATYEETKTTFFNRFIDQTTSVNNVFDIPSVAGDGIVLFNEPENNTHTLAVVEQGNITPLDPNVDLSEVDTEEFVSLTRDIITVDTENNNTVISVNGNLTDNNLEGVVSSLIDTSTQKQHLLKIVSLEYNDGLNRTIITLDGEIYPTLTPNLVCLQIKVLAEHYNHQFTCKNNKSYANHHWYNIGQYLFLNNVEVVNSLTGVDSIGTTTLTDNSINFDNILSTNATYQIEIKDGPNRGTYDILSFSGTSLELSTFLFSDSDVEYSVYQASYLDNLKNLTNNPQSGEVFYNSTVDIIFLHDGSNYDDFIYGFSNLINITDSEKKFVENTWTKQNKWVHKNQITDFGGKTQASMPIIEYDNTIELSYTSRAIYQWRYSRSSDSAYRKVDTKPSLFEIQPVIVESQNEFQYVSANKIALHEKYGNLENDISVGDSIVFSNFSANSGTYGVANIEFIVPSNPLLRAYTEIETTIPFADLTDYTIGGMIHPPKTALGDDYDTEHNQWQFGGLESITETSIGGERNPMLDILVDSNIATFGSQTYQTLIGQVWQEFVPESTYTQPTLVFDSTLADLCLYEDYQEGDIRVYINGERQYNIFDEIPDSNNTFITGIEFHSDVTISPDDRIRIELGEYFKEDIGKRAVKVFTGGSSNYTNELFNLVNTRVVEQEKSETTQYPNFKLYDVFDNPSDFSNAIFKFKEDATAPLNAETFLRIVRDKGTRDFTFKQLLFKNDSNKLLCYKDINDDGNIQSIWRNGNNNEIQIPQRLNSSEWDITNSWYYNLTHENNEEVTLREVFRHFNTIINEQVDSELNSATQRRFHAYDKPNYGVGGTIKEHNDNLDLLVSFALMNQTSIPRILEFAKSMYSQQLNELKEHSLLTITKWIDDPSTLSDKLISYVENNKKYDNWLGDSTAWDGTYGIKSFVASAAILGIIKPYTPLVINDGDQTLVRHHDGHLSEIRFSNNELLSKLSHLIKHKQISKLASEPFPNVNNFNNGDIILRIIASDTSATLYVLDGGAWQELDIKGIYANALVDVEHRLYQVALMSRARFYDFDYLKSLPKFNEYIERQFKKYTDRNAIDDPLSNMGYDPNDPWTWNYAYSTITTDPKNSSSLQLGIASWQGIYQHLFNTAYPHQEPWRLQGYDTKPPWWDTEYTDSSTTRKWTSDMWTNILSGTIPTNRTLPNGFTSNGATGVVHTYDYVVVNIDDNPTVDGIEPDGLLPPVWSSNNTSVPGMRAIYEKNVDIINSPNTAFLFGQLGYFEWNWKNSISYVYDLMEVAYYLDPMRFTHRTFGNEYVNVSCLQVETKFEKIFTHKDTIFHGEVIDNKVNKISGLSQWFTHFNRYNGFDGSSSEYRELWNTWDVSLGYTFDNVINTDTFDITSESIDLTNRDYSIELKKTEGLDDFWFKSLKAEVLRVPSLISRKRELSQNWISRITPISPETKEIVLYHPENYPIRRVSNTEFKTYNYELLNAGIRLPRTRLQVAYNEFITNSTSIVGYTPSTVYTTEFSTTSGNVTVSIDSDTVNVVQDIIDEINQQINIQQPDMAVAVVELGNIVIYGASSLNDGGIFDNLITSGGGFTDTEFTDSYEFTGFFELPLETEKYFQAGNTLEIINSTNFNGDYTILRTFADVANNVIRVFVEEDVALSNATIDGEVIPQHARTIPWETGQEVFFNSSGTLPNDLLDYVPYYIIKIDDYTFEIAETESLANKGTPIVITEDGSGQHKIGRVRNTFKPLASQVDFSWRRHFADKRDPFVITGSTTVSTIQSLTDIIFGYEEYLIDAGIISINDRLQNVDADTGRAYDWQLELEKYIAWMFTFRNLKNSSTIEVTGSINSVSNTIELENAAPWTTGTPISIVNYTNTLPEQISASLSDITPYYVIVNNGNRIQLATTKSNAKNGISIEFTGGIGEITLKPFRTYKNMPTRYLNPYVKQVAINHEIGLPADFTKGADTDVITTQRLYDIQNNAMTIEDVLFFRKDRQSVIETIENSEKEMAGGHIFLDGLEHVILFNNYSTDDVLIYDPFIGINTPRFFLEFVKPLEFTQRPTLSGMVLQGDNFYSSIEKAVSDIRYYYDVYNSFENEDTTIEARKSMGYQGRKDYLDDIGVNSKSQFIFWKGFIQSKGTKTSLDALSNHRLLDGMTVDEFWAYRLCSFGSKNKKIYPEMKLFTDDVVKKELRLEFSPPTGGVIGDRYTQVRLTDRSRWNNQPDILDAMSPDRAYYFGAGVSEFIEDVSTEWFSPQSNNIRYLSLNVPVEGIEVYYTNTNNERIKAVENIDYEMINNRLIRFSEDAITWSDISLAGLTYNYSSENPATLIDKARTAATGVNVPIWNPALNQHNPIGYYAVDVHQKINPAKYNKVLDSSKEESNYWSTKEVGTIWLDDTLLHYVPYYDRHIFPSVNDRSANWGRLTEFGRVELYQWIETDIPPEEYDIVSARESEKQDVPISERVTGNVKKDVYINVSGTMIKDANIVIPFSLPELSPNILQELNDFLISTNQPSVEIEIYINGSFFTTHQYVINDLAALTTALSGVGDKEYITIVKKVHTPSDEELEAGDYTIDIPHSVVDRYDPIKQDTVKKYYYWVTDLKNEKLLNNQSLTLFDAKRELQEMTRPYMIIEGLRKNEAGYGVLFGSTFDPDDPNLPTRYTQCIVKGLRNTVKDNDRYVLRFLKDYTLRDELNTNDLTLHNKHWEWKLFRKNQPFKIDRSLWNKLIESAIGYRIDESYNIDFDQQIPSLERETYDSFFPEFSTRIGLGRNQVLVDKNDLIDLLTEVLTSSNTEITSVDDIEAFMSDYDLDVPEDMMTMLRLIYDSFSDMEVNNIFFEILTESLRMNPEHQDFFKTSWVSIDVESTIDKFPKNIIKIPQVFPSERCFLMREEDEVGIMVEVLSNGINSEEINSGQINI